MQNSLTDSIYLFISTLVGNKKKKSSLLTPVIFTYNLS